MPSLSEVPAHCLCHVRDGYSQTQAIAIDYSHDTRALYTTLLRVCITFPIAKPPWHGQTPSRPADARKQPRSEGPCDPCRRRKHRMPTRSSGHASKQRRKRAIKRGDGVEISARRRSSES
eukprot:3880553-Pleurochrysis_carterae.AAC.1